MFIGHFGVGFGAKAAKPGVSLGTLFLAAQFIDLLWPSLLMLGIEHVRIEPGITKLTPLNFIDYPFSHSLLMVFVWAGVVGGIYWLIKKKVHGAMILGLCVLSHWFLDLIVHKPDLPLYPGNSPMLGFGLWNSFGATVIIEGIIFILGVALYIRSTEAENKTGVYSCWGLIGFLVLIHIANLFGDPPPSITAIAWVGQLQWLIVLWGYWIDRNRKAI